MFDTLTAAGRDPDKLTPDDLAPPSTPSFPPRLTTTQLASSYGSPCRTRSGLAPLSNRACRAHLKKAKILIDNGESTTIL